ncbi:DUF1850 domain-containing protein [Limoniibacter endophyticus]|uniref:DUF1850 domain-containing protein n=1 Tax=Limoniibacter endophyticus TaxID=1565040 RepID=A0A8J3GIC0_9HYPH|nr:DUF1850 domain-containing protein [Limoniibacter endophyticus]GHC77532.1 hypothetical protein GCM10010136_28820 [Limoniibacter endophyticus]
MAICIATAGGVLKLATTAFLLSWTHSVEKTPWEEDWVVTPQGMVIVEARLKGSGAGMEPPEEAVLKDGWYRYVPKIPPRQEIVLAASGKTVSGWSMCTEDRCLELGATEAEPVRIKTCN